MSNSGSSHAATGDPRGRRLDSWKEIAGYLGRDVTTVQRWERREALPVRRHRHGAGGSVYAYASELDAWRETRGGSAESGDVESSRPHLDPAEGTLGTPLKSRLSSRAALIAWLAAGVTLCVLLGALIVAPALKRREPSTASSSPAFTSEDVISISVFENRTGDRSLDPLGRLAADRLIKTVSRTTTARTVLHPGEAAGVGAAPSSGLVIEGAYYLHDNRLSFETGMVESATGRLVHGSDSVSGAGADEALERLEQEVAGAVAIHFDEFFGGLQIVSHAPTLDAYLEYRAGHEIFDRDYPLALAHLERSLEIDPAFWMPRLIIAFAYLNQGDEQKVRAVLKEVLSQRNRLSIAERMFVDYMNEMITGRYDEALHLITELSRLVPRSLGVNHNLAQMAIQLNRPRTAIRAIERLSLTEQHSRHRLGILRQSLLASALHMAGEYDRELEQITLARRHAPADLTFAARGAGALAALGRLDDVVRAVEHSLSVAPTSGNPVLVMELAAEELRAHGRREASLAMAARLVRWLRDRPSNEAATMLHREDLANALYLSEQWEEAGTLFAQLAADDPSRVELLGALGTTAARRGDTERARAVAEQLGGWSDPLHLGAPAFWRACIAALLNDRESAVDRLRESFAELPRSSLRLHRDPDLETLRDYPPYLDLVRLKD